MKLYTYIVVDLRGVVFMLCGKLFNSESEAEDALFESWHNDDYNVIWHETRTGGHYGIWDRHGRKGISFRAYIVDYNY